MSVAITFCDETKHERRKDKHDDSPFHCSETKRLSRLIQFGAPRFCRHESTLTGMNSIRERVCSRISLRVVFATVLPLPVYRCERCYKIGALSNRAS
jgi:hypothetical protein